jgi:hypothetical protein
LLLLVNHQVLKEQLHVRMDLEAQLVQTHLELMLLLPLIPLPLEEVQDLDNKIPQLLRSKQLVGVPPQLLLESLHLWDSNKVLLHQHQALEIVPQCQALDPVQCHLQR